MPKSVRYRMSCSKCDASGKTTSEETAAELVDVHNDGEHDGAAVAHYEVVG